MTDGAAPGPVTAIVVLGLMGAGKSTVGQLLAERLGWPLDDSDASIEASQGRTVRELRDEIGVDAMHALEARHLLDAIAAPRPRVIAPAAWVTEVPACRDALAAPHTTVVWLRATAATLAARFWEQPHRPAYGEDPEAFLAAQAARRDPWFRQVATLVVDVDDRSPDAVVERVLASLAHTAAPAHGSEEASPRAGSQAPAPGSGSSGEPPSRSGTGLV